MPIEGVKTNTVKPASFDVVDEKGQYVQLADLPPGARKIIFNKDELVKAKEVKNETFEVKETAKEQQNVLSQKDLNDKKFTSLTKRLDNLNNIENTRKELGLTDLKKEETRLVMETNAAIMEIVSIETTGVSGGWLQFGTKSRRKDRWSAMGMGLYGIQLLADERLSEDDELVMPILSRRR